MSDEAKKAERNEVGDINFWRDRIYSTVARGGMLHEIIYQEDYKIWDFSQAFTEVQLSRHVKPGCKVLDAGCGYGALLCCFERGRFAVDYTGVDFSPDLIQLAKFRYDEKWDIKSAIKFPKRRFLVANLAALPFGDKEFDWTICRSVRTMIEGNYGKEVWEPMRKEIERVSQRIMYFDYPTALEKPPTVEITSCP